MADPADSLPGGLKDLGDGVAAQVGQLHALQVGPQPLHRVQVVGITGQVLHGEPVPLALQPGPITRL